MSIHPFLTMEGTTQRPSGNSPNPTHTYQPVTQAQTPPGSTSGSPKVKIEGKFWSLFMRFDVLVWQLVTNNF
jgi:hypothetical protein